MATESLIEEPGHASRDRSPRTARIEQVAPLIGLLAIGILVQWRSNWGVDLVLVGLCFTVPGVLLLRALRIPASTVAGFPVYVPAASTVVMLTAGLTCDLVAPRIGVAHPLHGLATAEAVLALSLVLWVIGLPASAAARLPWRDWLSEPGLPILALALPALSALGALVLSNEHSALLARISVFVDLAVFVVCLVAADRLNRRQLVALLFSCALALEWSWSLRGQEVIGFDISTEYYVAQHAQAAGIWHTLHRNDAYGAMLSVGLLPSILRSLTGLSILTSFKALYPAGAALLPVGVFLVGERFLSRRFAVIASGLLLSQAYFFQQLPELARQEVALVFFAAMLTALLETGLSRWRQSALAALFAAALVVSHYSSAYLAIPLMVVACGARLLAGRWRRISMVSASWVAVAVVLVGGSALWYKAITKSANNVSEFVTLLDSKGLDLLPRQGGLVSTYLTGNNVRSATPQQLERMAVEEYRKKAAFVRPLAEASESRYDLEAVSVPSAPQRSPSVSSAVNNVFLPVYNELLLVLLSLGSIALIAFRRTTRIAGEVGLLALGGFAFLIFIRLSSTAAAEYNETRALAQSLVLLALPAAWTLQVLATRLTRWLRVLVWPVAVVAVGLVLAQQSGALEVPLGGGTSLNLSANGEDYQRYYATPAEYAGARFAAARADHTILYADRYGQLRLYAVSGRSVLTNVMPRTLDEYAWVYATRTNVQLHSARAQVNSTLGVYRWPASFLNRYFDRVYDNGDSAVYHAG